MSRIYTSSSTVSVEGRYAAFFAHKDPTVVDVFDLQERRYVRRGNVNRDRGGFSRCKVAGEVMYGGMYEGGVHAVNLLTGEDMWKQPKVQKLQRVIHDPINDWLYCQHDDFQTTILNAEDGKVVQKLRYWWLPLGEGDYAAGSVFEEGVICRETKSWKVVTTLGKADLLPGMEKEMPLRRANAVGKDIYFCYNASSDPDEEEVTCRLTLDTVRGTGLSLEKVFAECIGVNAYDKSQDLILAFKPEYGSRPLEVVCCKRQTFEVIQSIVWTEIEKRCGRPGNFVFGGSHVLTTRGYLVSMETLEPDGPSLFASAPPTLLPLVTPAPEDISEEEKEYEKQVAELCDRIRTTEDEAEKDRLGNEINKLHAVFKAGQKAKQQELEKKN